MNNLSDEDRAKYVETMGLTLVPIDAPNYSGPGICHGDSCEEEAEYMLIPLAGNEGPKPRARCGACFDREVGNWLETHEDN